MICARLNRKAYIGLRVFGVASLLLSIVLTMRVIDAQDELHGDQLKHDSKKIEKISVHEFSRKNNRLLNDSNEQLYTFLPMNRQEIKGEEKEEDRNVYAKREETGVCQPKNRVLFLKTHKTGSSTVTSILQVYGYFRNLSFAVPKTDPQMLSSKFFKMNHSVKYDMLVNHARYNRPEMEKVMKPGAKYITIIREPTTQIESNFDHFGLTRTFELSHLPDPFKTFVANSSYYWNKYRYAAFRNYIKNPNLFDLGLSETDQESLQEVNKFIYRISQEFDLVLIQEYFNESLLLLKKLLCWKMEDILYVSKETQSSRFSVDSGVHRDSIHKWSWADTLLYDHFNKTLWRKIQEYGPSFKADLAEFESKLDEALHNCTSDRQRGKCVHMMRRNLDFTKLISLVKYGEQSLENGS